MSDSSQVIENLPAPPDAVAHVSEPRRDGAPATIQWLTGTVVIAIFAITFVLQAFQIPSPSMENTLLVGDYLLVDKVHFAPQGVWDKVVPYSPIRRGDIIVFRYPVHPEQHFVKRVIGVPGDRIRLSDKRLYVNGTLMRERYAIHRDAGINDYRDNFPDLRHQDYDATPRWIRQMRQLVSNGELLVPPGSYFVMGDNRDDSEDSRYWGFVPRENIIGRPFLIYWSLKEADQIEGVPSASENPAGKVVHFAYTLTHLFQVIRWDRTFRLVR